MSSPYRPTLANGMTGSSVAHGLAGGTMLPHAVAGMDSKFQTPKEGHPITGVKSSFPAPTHNYDGGMLGAHVVHNARI